MEKQEEITPGEVVESIGVSFQENLSPQLQEIEKKTRRIGRNSKIIDLRKEGK